MSETPRPSIDDITQKPILQYRGIGKSLKLGIGIAVLAACSSTTAIADHHKNSTREDLVGHWSGIARDVLLSQQEQRSPSHILYQKVVVTQQTTVRDYPTVDWVSSQLGTLKEGTVITGSGVLLAPGITPISQGTIQPSAYAVFLCDSANNAITKDDRKVLVDPKKICVIDTTSIQVPIK